ncbi:MAG TPA: hypothetical protein ENH40_06395 [Nitrospirae bacterium]|nr:hypothetical protein [Nitrospirota bacterium]
MTFNRKQLNLLPLNKRVHDLDASSIKPLKRIAGYNITYSDVASAILKSKNDHKSVILMIGAHVLRSGVQKYLIDMMERGYLSCIAMNGAGIIHDYELALIGATTESVSKYIKEGQFGLWQETGQLNDIIKAGYKDGLGMGESVGRAIYEGDLPFKNISILSEAYRLKIPVTIHVGIGYDIIHEHPNCDGAATGATSYKDFLTLAGIVQNLENGVVMNFGSAVMAPEVFLKALSIARNTAHQQGKEIRHFTTLVCDLHDLPDDFSKEPSRDSIGYYFRPWKTMLVRTVSDGGISHYIKGKHSETISSLWTALTDIENDRPG